MRNKFDEQLELLHAELIKMGALCEDAINCAVSALENNDAEMARRAMEAEEEVDRKESTVENICLRLLLQQQPVAKDLRVISAAMKMISDMERIADQASDIAELTKHINVAGDKISKDISKMAKETVKMVTDSINSFVSSDLALARSVEKYDDNVDEWFDKIKVELIQLISTEAESDGGYYIDLLMIAKYLERIGDHAVNIAEWVVFSVTGKHEER